MSGAFFRRRQGHRALLQAAISTAALLSVMSVASLAGVRGAGNDSDGARAAAPTDPTSEFAVLRAAAGSNDSVPREDLLTFQEDPAVAELGIDWSSARLMKADGGFVLRAVAGSAHVCLVATSATVGTDLACSAADEAARSGLFVRTAVSDTTVLTGLLPDGVVRATVVGDANGETAVTNNGLVASLASGPAKLTWSGPGGSRTVSLPEDPLSAGWPG